MDVFYSRYSERARLWLDLAGGVLFLLPMAVIIGWMSWPLFLNSYEIGEVSGNAGAAPAANPAPPAPPVGEVYRTR